MLKINALSIFSRAIEIPVEELTIATLIEDNSVFLNQLVENLGVLPTNPAFEMHPYKDLLPLNNYGQYIIGTFPPISYMLDKQELVDSGILALQQPPGAGGQAIGRPRIPFYHGNKLQGSMWKYLLTDDEWAALVDIIEENSPNKRVNARQYLVDFLSGREINYSDIIYSTQRRLNDKGRYDASDDNLYNIGPNYDLIYHCLNNPKAKSLLFNTSSIFGKSGIKTDGTGLVNVRNNTQSFDLFVRGCQELGYTVEIQVQQGNPATQYNWTNIVDLLPHQRKNKIVFELKITNQSKNPNQACGNFHFGASKIFTVVTPFSPAAVDRGKLRLNNVVQNWIGNGGNTIQLLNFAYQRFRDNDFAPLYNLNM
ncbi:hypothetical protein K3G39_20120 [Pontibacter sp. HSC-14F20]|uniref:hypothetical protein n=1 Tax=Pontibacter sp. HSC-14F20 TaxID=2864136 RepID=UPI001C731DDF|nr:hypothetical protein [Pontibacter sp. HSC-14F20]MBX0335544.1 hypothetical protein [Pontibacter sp. HSC-14F20]